MKPILRPSELRAMFKKKSLITIKIGCSDIQETSKFFL